MNIKYIFFINWNMANWASLTISFLKRFDTRKKPTMCKFKMKLLYNEEEFSGTKTELLNFKITLP